MQLLDTDTFFKTYDQASDEVRILIDSTRLPDFSQRLVTEHDLPKESIPGITRVLAHTILNLIGSDETAAYLKSEASVSDEKIQTVVSQIQTFLSHVAPEMPVKESAAANENQQRPLPKVTPLESRERLHLRPTAQAAAEAASWGSAPSVAPITRSHIRESLAPKRTMASDVAAARGEETPPTPIPRYARPMTGTKEDV